MKITFSKKEILRVMTSEAKGILLPAVKEKFTCLNPSSIGGELTFEMIEKEDSDDKEATAGASDSAGSVPG